MIRPLDRDVFVAVVLLHPRCNMTCAFCVTPDGAFEPLGFDEAVALLDRLVAQGIRSVVFGGGEPFAWEGDPERLVRLAREAHARGLLVQAGTNGVALPAGFAELDCIDRWVLPLESAVPRVPARRHIRAARRVTAAWARRASVGTSTAPATRRASPARRSPRTTS